MSSRKLRRVPGIKPVIVERLAKHRIFTCKDLLSKNHLELLKLTRASYEEVQLIQEATSKAVAPKPVTALQLHNRSLVQPAFFPTSLSALDKQLHGGLACGTITELAGPSGCGKTQFCIMLSILATLPQEHGGLAANVIYIDTEAAFSATRLLEMAEARLPELFNSSDSLLKLTEKVHVYWETSCTSLWSRLQSLEEEIIARKVKLVVLDSIASLVRKEFDSRISWNLTERTSLLSREAAVLKYLAKTFNIPIVVTNQITTRFSAPRASKPTNEADADGPETEADDDVSGHVTAALGNTWSHAVNTRLIVQYMNNRLRQVVISKSPVAPFCAFTYSIQTQGIVLEQAFELHSDQRGPNSHGNPSLQTIQVRTAVT